MVQKWVLTHCKNGHEFTPANTYERPDGSGRTCRACQRTRAHEKTRKKREDRGE